MIPPTHELEFRGEVILITGAGRGLGRCYADLLAARGARLVVNDLGTTADSFGSSSEVAEAAVKAICENGGDAISNCCDITTQDGAKAAVSAALDAFGRLDVVINNAGSVRTKSFSETTFDDLDQMLRVHVQGSFWVSQAAWPAMVSQDCGRIVMTTSSAGLYGQVGLAAYSTAKAAINGLTKTLALEGKPHNIKVNAVSPLGHTRLNEDLPGKRRRAFFENHARAAQVAPLVAYLAHSNCAHTGQIIDAGAGRFSNVLIGQSRGYIDVDASIETISNNFDEIMSASVLSWPMSADDAVTTSFQLATNSSTAP